MTRFRTVAVNNLVLDFNAAALAMLGEIGAASSFVKRPLKFKQGKEHTVGDAVRIRGTV